MDSNEENNEIIWSIEALELNRCYMVISDTVANNRNIAKQ